MSWQAFEKDAPQVVMEAIREMLFKHTQDRNMVGWKSINIIAIILACVVGISSCQQVTPLVEPDHPEVPFANALQEAIDRVQQTNQNHPALGISAAIIVPGYRTWTGVSGNSQPGVPLTEDMLFDAGSIEKNFQAALILELAEEEMLNLDDPIYKYLPDYPNVDGEITIRQLLNHTSGLFNVFEHPDFPWVGTGVDYSRSWPVEEVFSQFVLEPYGPPGFVQHYSSTNYLLLTEIIEEVSGTSVPEEMNRRFLEPLGLEHTYLSMSEPPPSRYSIAHPWADIDQDGNLDDLYGIPLTWKVTLTHPVIFSTPNDLARWMNALYHDRIVLNTESHNEMLTYPETALRDPEGGLYGLGVVDYTDRLGLNVIGHGGSSLGYAGAALYLPDYGISVAWLINTGESPPELANQIMSDTWLSLFEVLSRNQAPRP